MATTVIFEYNGLKVHLINVPGFDDTTRSDTDILKCVASYFAATYQLNIKMDGIIYISPITERRMSSAAVKHLHLLFKMIGHDALSNVVLATSGWNKKTSRWDIFSALGWNWGLGRGKAEAGEKQLREGLWIPFIEGGSKVCRLHGGKEAAFHILDVLLPGGEREGQVLQIQRELVENMKTLDETEAGHQLLKDIRELSREPGPEDGRKQLRAGFERLVRQKWDVNASLFRRLEMDRMKKAAVIDELNSKLRARGAQMQPKESKFAQCRKSDGTY